MLAIQAVAVLALSEVGLRLLRDRGSGIDGLLFLPSERTEYDDAQTTAELLRRTSLGYRPGERSAGFVRNRRGLPTGDYTVAPGPGERRILVLGDSFVFNDYPVAWMWPAQLERELLSRLADQQVVPRVFTFGIPGAGPAVYQRLWELEGPEVRAELVLVGFFVGNDLAGLDDESQLGGEPRAGWLVRQSLVLRAARNLSRILRNRAGGGAGFSSGGFDAVDRSRVASGPQGGGHEVEGYRERFETGRPTLAEDYYWAIKGVVAELLLPQNEARHRKAVERAGAILSRLERSVTRHGARLVIVIIPDELQIHEEVLAEALRRKGVERSVVDVDLPQRLLIAELDRRDLESIDLLPPLRRRSAEPLHRVRDTHWNRRGNRLAARVIADRIGCQLLPCSPGPE